MARQTVATEVKAAALADLQSGEQPAIVAERYGLKPGTVRQWKNRLDDVTPHVTLHHTKTVTRRPTIEEHQLTIAELVAKNLQAKLIATQRIAEHVTREDWLNKQNAADVAGLFETLDRSAIGILDRLAGAQRALPGDTAE